MGAVISYEKGAGGGGGYKKGGMGASQVLPHKGGAWGGVLAMLKGGPSTVLRQF